jgi:hypothetical protein
MDVNYLELYLRARRPYLENEAATQTAQKNINLQVLRPLLVPCPTRAEQERIAAEVLLPLGAASKARRHAQDLRDLGAFITSQVLGDQR